MRCYKIFNKETKRYCKVKLIGTSEVSCFDKLSQAQKTADRLLRGKPYVIHCFRLEEPESV